MGSQGWGEKKVKPDKGKKLIHSTKIWAYVIHLIKHLKFTVEQHFLCPSD